MCKIVNTAPWTFASFLRPSITPRTPKSICDKTPELNNFLEVCDEKQQMYFLGYQMIDWLF